MVYADLSSLELIDKLFLHSMENSHCHEFSDFCFYVTAVILQACKNFNQKQNKQRKKNVALHDILLNLGRLKSLSS